MTDTPEPRLPAARLDQLRERTVQRLCEHYAHDHLTEQELQERLDLVYQAMTTTALQKLEADLPALGADEHAPATHADVARAASGEVRDRQVVAAVMSGVERKGSWAPARQLIAIAVMGGVVLDFREARFAPGVTEVNIFAMMGGVEIVAPPGVRIENDGFAFMGGWEMPESDAAALAPDAPTLRLNGLAVMAGVEVSTRLPGETVKDARARRRLERERRRKLRRGDR